MCRPSARWPASGRSSTARRSGWPKRSRCSSGRGTSKGSRSGPTTGWWGTPGSSPPPGCSTPTCRERSPGVRGCPRNDSLNLLDLMIIVLAGAAAYGGYRLGFLARIFSWAGLAIGALVADRFLPDVVGFFSSSDPQIRLIAAISFLVGAAMLGQGVGLAVGSLLHAALPLGTGLRQGDRVAGSALGIIGVLVAVWLLTPALAAVPGWPAESTRESSIAHLVEDVAPAAPETMQALRRFVQDGTFPAVFNELRRSPDPGPPPIAGLDEAVHQRVEMSTVKITGEACRRIQEGSGFVAMPGLVVTNAHVVAGEKAPRVEPFQGRSLPATVVLFDANRDLALLRVPGLAEQPLAVDKAQEGETGAVYGHPGGGDLRA